MIFRDLSKDIGQLVRDLQNQEKSQVQRTEERTFGKGENAPKLQMEYNMKARTLPSKEEMEEYRKEIKQRDKDRLE
ncbi:hypothetical protein CHL76_08035 [Marinococcus halophilus]|uniref:Uncharacterized protein n=1 Tax=Marinococcus halophilus TaxID=1371 RepID=A0A510Y802_MARHA|nr:hypothetical protein [Marinococcus halophilus]OZT80465.1 hypothetical protein CHL76_08035 [Marinococcus halophilus]GEK58537.1 hypothetical protein MHA01_14420 [Marinococcus halophilus]